MGKTAVKNENFYVVQGWMRNLLGLRGNALDIYAIIYGFSQGSHQEFTASINYLCEWLGASRPTVINTLKDLVAKGYLTKESNEINGVIYNRYTAVVPDFTEGKETLLPQLKNFIAPSKETLLPQLKNFIAPSKETLPNNINNNIEDNNLLSEIKGEQAPLSEKKPTQKEITIKEVYGDPSNEVILEALRLYHAWFKSSGLGYRGTTVAKWAKLLLEYSEGDPLLAVEIVKQSISKGWKTLFPLKKAKVPYNDGAKAKKWDGDVAKDEHGNEIVY